MHNSFLNIDNKKMSKSLGNFKTLRDVGETFGYDVVRFFMLSAHYRSPLNFSADLMEAAKAGLERIKNGLYTLEFAIQNSAQTGEVVPEELAKVDVLEIKFHEAMEDDFNTADAISAIFELVKLSNTKVKEGASKTLLQYMYEKMKGLVDILGLVYEKEVNIAQELTDEEINEYIEKRKQAKKEKNFQEADAIRDLLKDKGVIIEDTREGVRFKRI
jgi:cysteinyl-tRNA synthetase